MKSQIAPHALSSVFELMLPDVEILSLDCFDTLVWRNTHSPADVFADLPELAPGLFRRQLAETYARSRARLTGAAPEVTIADIYRTLVPHADEAAIADAVTAELAAEARHCFAFRPTVDLIREARSRGMRVIIVSDTYLDREQLSGLIAAVAGDDVVALIDDIFCSSEYGVHKHGGLFRHVLDRLKIAPGKIIHVGDNELADFEAPTALGIGSVHLVQFDEATKTRLRLESAAAMLLNPGVRHQLPMLQPHRAQLAIAQPELEDAAYALGYATLGPIMHGFVCWLNHEISQLKRGRATDVHVVFLLRDGYLPKCAFDALSTASGIPSIAIEISRFTAIASSFADEQCILRYLQTQTDTGNFEAIAQQLLFTDAEIRGLLGQLPAEERLAAFAKQILRAQNIKKIGDRSRAFARRLVNYVRKQVQPKAGDMLLFVDLGYNGSVQNYVEPLLRRELGVDIAGRYLLLREKEISACAKQGFFDTRHFDEKALEALTTNVAVLEQLSTTTMGSVLDYKADGEPLRSHNTIKSRQSAVRDTIQQACVAFVGEQGKAFERPPRSDTLQTQRDTAAAVLARFMFLPMNDEIEVLERFEHDVNLGTQSRVKLFDKSIANEGLKNRGLFYINGSDRMYLPAELRGQGLSLNLTLFAQRRFGLDLRYPDFCDRRIELPIMIADGNDVVLDRIDANPTHDGHFLAAVPIGPNRLTIGLLFGRLYEWVQIQAVQFAPLNQFLSHTAHGDVRDARPVCEGMGEMAPGLFRCLDETDFMMVPPPPETTQQAQVLLVVFRPIVNRMPTPDAAETLISAPKAQASQTRLS